MSLNTIEINNMGAVEHVTVPVPDGGGLVVFKGRNGCGKSTALNAINSIVTGQKQSIPLRQGTKKGEVEGLGVTLKLGKSTRRSGEAEVVSLEGRLNVADLVDPGIKSADAADAKRIKALIGISNATASDATLYEIAGGKDAYLAIASEATVACSDIVEKCERFKRDLEKHARQFEDEAANHEGAAKALDVDAKDVPEVMADADKMLEDAIAARAKLTERQRERERVLSEQKELRENLDEVKRNAETKSVTHIQTRLGAAESQRDMLSERITKAERELQTLRDNRQQWVDSITELNDELEQAEKYEASIAALEEQLAKSAPEPVATADLEHADLDVATYRRALLDNEAARKMLAQLAERNAALDKCKEARKKAEQLRDSAQGLDEVLSSLVGDGPLRVEDGRLVLTTERGTTYFSELSHGERWRIALELAAKYLGDGGALVVPQEAYEGLDPKNRAELSQIAKEVGVIVFTAEASDGEQIAAEVVG